MFYLETKYENKAIQTKILLALNINKMVQKWTYNYSIFLLKVSYIIRPNTLKYIIRP